MNTFRTLLFLPSIALLSSVTTVPTLEINCQKIKNAGGNLTGCVMNDRFNPTLKNELLRQINKLPPWSPKWILSLMKQWINRNRLLSFEL